MKHSEREDLVLRLIEGAFFSSAPRRPGVVIEHFPKETREKIKQLTSEDFQHWIVKELA